MKVDEVVTPGFLKCDVHKAASACEDEVRGHLIRMQHSGADIGGPWSVDMCGKAARSLIAAIEAKTQPVTRTRKAETKE